MAETYKILAQSNPVATTETDVYTVPASTSTVISTITLANRSTTVGVYIRLSFAPAGAVTDDKHFTHYGVQIAPRDTLSLTLGITLATTDVVRVYTDNATLSVNVFGLEVT